MKKLGKKQLTLDLKVPLESLPASVDSFDIQIKNNGRQLIYTYETGQEHTGIAALLKH